MRNIVAGLVLIAAAAANAQSGAPLHHAGKVVKNRYHRVGHNVRATGHYIGHKVRGLKKSVKNWVDPRRRLPHRSKNVATPRENVMIFRGVATFFRGLIAKVRNNVTILGGVATVFRGVAAFSPRVDALLGLAFPLRRGPLGYCNPRWLVRRKRWSPHRGQDGNL